MNFYPRRRKMPVVIIVSLIDIFAILLIFVIVTSTFKRPQHAVTIRLPEAGAASAVQPKAETFAELAVTAEGNVFLEGQPVELPALPDALKLCQSAGLSVALRADEKAPFGVILSVLDALKTAGIGGSLPTFTEKQNR